MDTNTATAPNTPEYRAIANDAAVIRDTLEKFPNLPIEAQAALHYRLEILEFQAAKMAHEWSIANSARQRNYSASLSRTYLA